MRLFDSHSHLQDERFDEDREAVLGRAAAAGVETIVVCGEDVESSQAAVGLAERTERPKLLATAGFHPHEASRATTAALDAIETLARNAGVVAIGEIGLDFYRDLSPRDLQRRVFDAQLALAAQLGLPVTVHSRDAEEDLSPHLETFAAESPLGGEGRPLGVLHAFGGTLEQARRYVELGFLVSLTCAAGYPRNDEARRIAAGLPLSALLIETDSPALPPQSARGTRNEPANVRAAAEVVAEARGVGVEAVAAATTANAQALFAAPVAVEAQA
ncbi:MAG: TatD family deoxyribonuclease [Dehalococcoidia bacterium]|nr:TatD family deoxyribonuclease [Dehalococcoidia bacterium]MYI86081.1 TatD family deoxyribonuclease [Dehalococcoidia bacterium]